VQGLFSEIIPAERESRLEADSQFLLRTGVLMPQGVGLGRTPELVLHGRASTRVDAR